MQEKCFYYLCRSIALIILHLFIQTISIEPLQAHYYSEALLEQHGYCAGVSRRSAICNCKLRTCPRSLVAARAGFEPTALQLKGIDSTNVPSNPTLTMSYTITVIEIKLSYCLGCLGELQMYLLLLLAFERCFQI